MNKVSKRILSALLSIVLIVAMVPATAAPVFAADPAVNIGIAAYNGRYVYWIKDMQNFTEIGVKSVVIDYPAGLNLLYDETALPTDWYITVSESSSYMNTATIVTTDASVPDAGVDHVAIEDYLVRGTGADAKLWFQTKSDSPLIVGAGISVTLNTNIMSKFIDGRGQAHYYEFVFTPDVADKKTWLEAYNSAYAKILPGTSAEHGYLATITSIDEQLFIYNSIARQTGWLGGTRMLESDGSGGWQKINNTTGTLNDTYIEGTTYNIAIDTANRWYWACGPETETEFYNKVRYADTGTGPADGVFNFFSNQQTVTAYPNVPNIRNSTEPNNASNSEASLQFAQFNNGVQYASWNDGNPTDLRDVANMGYYIEWTPENTLGNSVVTQVEQPKLGALDPIDFGSVDVGYSNANMAQTVTVRGYASALSNVTVTLSDSTNFEILSNSFAGSGMLAVNSVGTFQIRPVASLDVGTYKASVTIKGTDVLSNDYDTSFDVTFTVKDYALTTMTNPEGKGTVLISPAKARFAKGETVTYTNNMQNDAGNYYFDGWTATPSVGTLAAEASGGTFAMPASDVTLTANFLPRPTVVSLSAGASPDVNGSIIIMFSEPMGAGKGTVSLAGGAGTVSASTAWAWSSDGRTLTVPYTGLNWATQYTVTVGGDFKNASGKGELVTSNNRTFTTRGRDMVNFTIKGYKNDAGSPDNLLYEIAMPIAYSTAQQYTIAPSSLPKLAPEWKLKTTGSALIFMPNVDREITLLYETGVTTVTVYAKLYGTTTDVIAPIMIPGVELGTHYEYLSPSIPGYTIVDSSGQATGPYQGAIASVAANDKEIVFKYVQSTGNLTVTYVDDDIIASPNKIGETTVTLTANTPAVIPFPNIDYYTKVSAAPGNVTWNGVDAITDVTLHYKRDRQTVTLRAFNTGTGAQIGGDYTVAGSQRVGEIFSLTAALAALDAQVDQHSGIANYTRLAGSVNWFVDAASGNNIINVYYQPKTAASVTVNIRTTGEILQTYEILSAVNEVVTVDPAKITIAGYSHTANNGGSPLSVTVSANAAANVINVYMTDDRHTVTVNYQFSDSTTRPADTYKAIGGENFSLPVPYIPGYALKGYTYQVGTADVVTVTADRVNSSFLNSLAADVNVTLTYQSIEAAANENYVTVTVEGYKDSDGDPANLLYSYTKRVKKSSTQGNIVPETELPQFAPNWKLKSGNGTITPDSDKTVKFIYETGITGVTVEARAFGDTDGGSPLITPIVIQNVVIGSDFPYQVPSIPGYQAVDRVSGDNISGSLTLNNVPASNGKLTFYYKPTSGNLTVICKDELGAEIYRSSQTITTNATAADVPIPTVDHHTVTTSAVMAKVTWNGTATGWVGTTSSSPPVVVYNYTRDRVTVTLHGKNAGDGSAVNTADLNVTASARVNGVLDVTAKLAELDADVSGANIPAVRMTTNNTVYVGASNMIFDVLYREAKKGAMLVKVVADSVVPERILYSYFIEGLADGETVTVNNGTISFEGYSVVNGTYAGTVNNSNLSQNVITVPMTDQRHTVTVYEVIHNVIADTDDPPAKTTSEKYAYTQGRFISTPYRPGYSAIEYKIGSGSFTPLGTSEGVTLSAGNMDYEVTFRYVTLAEAVKIADVTIYAKLFSDKATNVVSPIISNRRVGEPFSYSAPDIDGYVLVHDDGTLWAEAIKTKSLASVSETVSANTLTFYYKPEFTMQRVNLIDDTTNAVFASYEVRVDVDKLTTIPADLSLAPTMPTDFTAFYEDTGLNVPLKSVTWDGSGALPVIGYRFTRKTVNLTLRAYDSIRGTQVPGAADVVLSVRTGEPYDFSGSLNALTANVRAVLGLGDTAELLESSTRAAVALASLEVPVFYTLKSSVEDAVAGGLSVITIVGKARDKNGAVLYRYVKTVMKSAAISQVVLPSEVFDLAPAWTLTPGQEAKMSFAPTDNGYTVEFYYRAQDFEIVASAGTGGSISPSGTAVVTQGVAQVYTVTADSGYHIVSVLVDGVEVFALSGGQTGQGQGQGLTGQGQVFTYTFDNATAGNHTIFAAFAEDNPSTAHSIAAAASYGGTISPSGTFPVVQGTAQGYTVTADAGYHVVYVLVDGTDVYALSGGQTGQGQGQAGQGQGQASQGQEGQGQAGQGLTGQGQVFTYTFDNTTAGNHTIFAVFAKDITYSITAYATATGGRISPNGITAVVQGVPQTYTITTEAGYHIVSVLVDGAEVYAGGQSGGNIFTYTFSNAVAGNHTIFAAFAEDKAATEPTEPTDPTDPTKPTTATITATAGAGGTISHPGANTVTLGGSITFNITANSGYRINAVLVDSVNVGAVSSYTFSNVTTNHSITANFAASGGGGLGGGSNSSSGGGRSDLTRSVQTTKPAITTDGKGTESADDTPAAAEKPWFRDVPQTAWFYEDVKFVTDKGLFKGTDEFMFSPNIPTTRGMIVTVLYRLAGEPSVTGSSTFSDVKSGSYYANAVAWANVKGIVYGVGDNRFEPDRSITRQELAVIILRYTEFAVMSLERVREGGIFEDARSIGDWALSAVDELHRAGIVNGKDRNVFDPMGEATRAEVAAMLHRLIGGMK